MKYPNTILFFDTETTGKADFNQPPESETQPDLVQLAAMLWDEKAQTVRASLNIIIHPHNSADPAKQLLFRIPSDASGIHGITHELAISFGQPRRTALSLFNHMCRASEAIAAHNISFDELIMLTAYHRETVPHRLLGLKRLCTMKAATPVLKLPKPAGWKGKPKPGDEYKWPTLTECYQHFFNETFDGAHNAMNDVLAMMKVWRELIKLNAKF